MRRSEEGVLDEDEEVGDAEGAAVLDPASYEDDEAYARALQDAKEHEVVGRLMALVGISDLGQEMEHDVEDDDEDEEDGDSTQNTVKLVCKSYCLAIFIENLPRMKLVYNIFNDVDGALSDVELNEFQIRCFDTPLQPAEIACVKLAVQEKLPEGVNVNGLTLAGFL